MEMARVTTPSGCIFRRPRSPKRATFDIKLQGNTVAAGFDHAKAQRDDRGCISLEFSGVRVQRNLDLELIADTPSGSAPMLSGLEVFSTNQLVAGSDGTNPHEKTARDWVP